MRIMKTNSLVADVTSKLYPSDSGQLAYFKGSLGTNYVNKRLSHKTFQGSILVKFSSFVLHLKVVSPDQPTVVCDFGGAE